MTDSTVELPADAVSNTVELAAPESKPKGVRGWLLFFIITLVFINPISSLVIQALTFGQILPAFERYPGLLVISVIDIVLSVGILGLSIYAGVALWRTRPGAVRVARIYLVTGAVYTITSPFLVFLAGLPSSANGEILTAAITGMRGVVYYALWFAYLNQSKRVRATYPDATFPSNKRIERTAQGRLT